MSRNNTYQTVDLTNEAQTRFHTFEKFIVDEMNSYPDGAVRNILNRCNLKALRLAALAAVAYSPKSPTVTIAHAEWAIRFVEADCSHMMARFEKGYVGEGDNKQLSVLRAKIRQFITKPEATNNTLYEQMLMKSVVPHSALAQKLLKVACFDQDKRGANTALNLSIKALIDSGEIIELSKQQAKNDFGTTSKCYIVNSRELL